MQTETQVVPIRTPETTFDENIITVIGPDGRTNPATDPKLDTELVVDMYKAMIRTRLLDEQLVRLQRQGRIGFHIGSLGEEACIIASAAAMRKNDWIFPCYREFGALLWRGFPLQSYMDNMYGNADDIVKGRQMPDHYTAKDYRFGSVSSPIGTQMSQAVGLAWAARKKGNDEVVSVYFGEGATSSNDFHTGMNFAGVMNTPTIFLCRNNHWAISVPSEKQSASESFADKAIAYGMRRFQVDGNDAIATYKVVREAVELASAGKGPSMIEMITYRMSGHSTSDDPRAYRENQEVEQWTKMDPVVRLRRHLDVLGAWDDAQDAAWRDQVEAEIKKCVEIAENKDKPTLDTMFEGVFENKPWHIEEQEQECVSGPRAKAGH